MTNLGKKSNRLQLLESYFNKLTSTGYKQETYKDLNIFTKFENNRYYLSVYKGTSTKDLNNYYFRTFERMQEVVDRFKRNADTRQQYKENAKNNPTVSTHANTAKAIRLELKKAFPIYKFSVTSECFSGGDSVHISWTDGATVSQIEEIVNKYQYGHFDGMTDMYEYSNRIEGLPQTKFVSTNRTISEGLKAILTPDLTEFLKSHNTDNYRDDLNNVMHRIFSRTEIKDINNVKGIEEDHNSKLSGIDGFYKIAFKTEEPEPAAAQPSIKPIESAEGEVNVIEYSEKAIAVIGDTKPIKELLKSLGGSFNPRLNCGAGWIFSKKKLTEVQNALLKHASKKENTEEFKTDILALPAHEETQSTQLTEIVQEVEAEILPILNDSTGKKIYTLEYFKIIWHEGRHIEGAIFENVIFYDWQEIQNAFFKLWEVNEKGQEGGYTKVKCEIKFKDIEATITRIDITNRANNGDFNPSEIHVLNYIENTHIEAGETIQIQPNNKQNNTQIEQYNNIKEITEAAESGKQISLFNLSNVINNTFINA